MSDLFSYRFREGISFPNFVERFILKLPLSKFCAVPLLYRTEHFSRGRTGRKGAQKRGGKEAASRGGGKMEKRTCKKQSVLGPQKIVVEGSCHQNRSYGSDCGTLISGFKNLLMPLFLMACFPVDFQEAKRPLRTKSGERPIKVGKRPVLFASFTRRRSFALVCALLRSCVCPHLRSLVLICMFLRPTAFRTTAFGNSGDPVTKSFV